MPSVKCPQCGTEIDAMSEPARCPQCAHPLTRSNLPLIALGAVIALLFAAIASTSLLGDLGSTSATEAVLARLGRPSGVTGSVTGYRNLTGGDAQYVCGIFGRRTPEGSFDRDAKLFVVIQRGSLWKTIERVHLQGDAEFDAAYRVGCAN